LRKWLAFSGVFGFLAVASGALGAHIIGDQLSIENLQRYETAVRYQMWHALALLAVAWLAAQSEIGTPWTIQVAGWAFTAGIVLFSGSLYALSFTGERSLAAFAPVGGISLMVGWLALLASAFRRR